MMTVLLHLFDVLGNELEVLRVSAATLTSATNRAVAHGYAQRNADRNGPRVQAFVVRTDGPEQLSTALWTCYDVRDRRVTFEATNGGSGRWFIRGRDGMSNPLTAMVGAQVLAHEQEEAEVRALVSESLVSFLGMEVK